MHVIDPNMVRLAEMRDAVRVMRNSYPQGPRRSALNEAADRLDLAAERVLRGDAEPPRDGFFAPVLRFFLIAAIRIVYAVKALAAWLSSSRF